MNELLKNLGKVSITGEGQWSSNREWERLSAVYKINSDNTIESFLSRKYVPIGIDIYNTEYWQPLALTIKGGSGSGGDTPTPGPNPPVPDTYYTINVRTNIATGIITINGVQKNSGSYLSGTVLTIKVTDSEQRYNQKTVTHIVTADETINVNFTNGDIIDVEEYFYVKINSINVNDPNIIIKVGSERTYVGNTVSVPKGQTTNVTAVDPNGNYETYNSGPITNDVILDIEMNPVSTAGVTYEMIAKSWTYNAFSKNMDCVTLYKIIGQHYSTGYETVVSDVALEEYSPIKINGVNKGAASFYTKKFIDDNYGNMSSPFYGINQLDPQRNSIFKVTDNLNDDDIIIYHRYAFSTNTIETVNISCLEKSSNKPFTISFSVAFVGPESPSVDPDQPPVIPVTKYTVSLGTVKFANVDLTSEELAKLNIAITAINNSTLSTPKTLKGTSQEVEEGSYIEVSVIPLSGSEFKEHKFYYTISSNTTLNLVLSEKQPGALTSTKVYLGRFVSTGNSAILTKGTDWTRAYISYRDVNGITREQEIPETEAAAIDINIGERVGITVECPNASNYRADDYNATRSRAYGDSLGTNSYIVIGNNMKGFTAYLKPTAISIELPELDDDDTDEEDEGQEE